jgi:antirestriction protein ArdC
MKRDLYADVSARIVAELETGAAPWIKPWSATAGMNTPCNAVTNRPYSGCNVVLLWMAQAAGYSTPRFVTFKQALEFGGNVRKGEHGTKVYFVKKLAVQDRDRPDDESATRVVPMLREYTVFNVDQCENLPARVTTSSTVKPRNRDARDATIDGDLRHAGYIQSWIGLLKADGRAFFTAASKAQAAADYLRGLAVRDVQPAMAA